MRISPFAEKIRAINARLVALRDRLAELVAAQERRAFEARLAALAPQPGPPLGVVFFPWLDNLPQAPVEDIAGSGREGARQRTDQEIEAGGGSGMIEFEPLPPDSGGGGGGGF